MNGIQWMTSQKFRPLKSEVVEKREHELVSDLEPEVDREVRRLLKSGHRKSVVARMLGLKYHAVRMIYQQVFEPIKK